MTRTLPGASPQLAPQSLQDREGIPPDLADEIEQKMAERQARQTAERAKRQSTQDDLPAVGALSAERRRI